MSVDGGIGEHAQQLSHQLLHRHALQQGASVGWVAVLIQSTFVADANGISVVPLTVRTDLLDGSPCVDGTRLVNDEVIADSLEASLLVPTGDSSYIRLLSWASSSAMDDDLVNASHKSVDY